MSSKNIGRLAEKQDPERLKIWASAWVIERPKQILSVDFQTLERVQLLFVCDCYFLSLNEIK